MGLAQNIQGSEGIWLHGAAFWTFFQGEVSGCYDCKETICGEGCIMNAARVGGGVKGLWWFGVNTRCADVMVLDGKFVIFGFFEGVFKVVVMWECVLTINAL